MKRRKQSLTSLPFSLCLIFLLISFFLAFASAEIFFFSCFLFFTASSSLSGFHFKSQLPQVNFHVTSSSSFSKLPLVTQTAWCLSGENFCRVPTAFLSVFSSDMPRPLSSPGTAGLLWLSSSPLTLNSGQ